MPFKFSVALLALVTFTAMPASAWAIGFGFGCSNLPETARAQGALQGMTSACDMSVAEARRILAGQQGYQAVAPAPRAHHHRNRLRTQQ